MNSLQKKIGLLASFRKEFPKLCDFLKWCESGKERCVICDEPESPSFVQCDTEDCPFGYCFDCWQDVRVSLFDYRWPVNFLFSSLKTWTSFIDDLYMFPLIFIGDNIYFQAWTSFIDDLYMFPLIFTRDNIYYFSISVILI